MSSPAGSSRRTVSNTCLTSASAPAIAARCCGEPSGAMMAGIIGLGQPQDRDRRGALFEDIATEALGHRAVPGDALCEAGACRIVNRDAARAEAAGRMMDPAMPVRILEIGGPRRDIGAGDRVFAVPAQPLGQGRDMQGAAGRAAHAVAEIGRPRRAADEPLALVERHRVAEEAVPCRPAAGRDRGGAGARRRGEDAAMRRKKGGALLSAPTGTALSRA